ncbi:hypothetical protein BD779DRAFT_1610490 [Infundibulicybe gibba]|nr:hypothetical protein BD779DRAFT_1610490 [Infundibulicybe gibba]
MAYDFSSLKPRIYEILSAPGTDLTTISAKRVRRQLLELDPTLTAEFLRDNKDEVDAEIASVFEKVTNAQGPEGTPEDEPSVTEAGAQKRKRADEDESEEGGEEGESTPPPKKSKKAAKNGRELSDAELARKLSSEINSRSRRTASKGRGGSNGTPKKGGRSRKSAATVDSDEDTDDQGTSKKKPKAKKSSGEGGPAKGGFAKEYLLSEPLSNVLKTPKLSRPQVVKQLWVYIKHNELQNPSNKREIMCDINLRAVFGVDKIDMFKMNKVLGDHLHENEG